MGPLIYLKLHLHTRKQIQNLYVSNSTEAFYVCAGQNISLP